MFQASIILCDSAPVQWFMVPPVFSSGLSSHQLPLPMRLLVLLKASFAEAAHWACMFLGQLMLTRSFDHGVGRGRGSRADSHAGGSSFP